MCSFKYTFVATEYIFASAQSSRHHFNALVNVCKISSKMLFLSHTIASLFKEKSHTVIMYVQTYVMMSAELDLL